MVDVCEVEVEEEEEERCLRAAVTENYHPLPFLTISTKTSHSCQVSDGTTSLYSLIRVPY